MVFHLKNKKLPIQLRSGSFHKEVKMKHFFTDTGTIMLLSSKAFCKQKAY